MSGTPVQDAPVQGLSSDSGQTLPSRPLQPVSDPSASKRVCFYKSGDYKFSGHRMVVNARIFKTFDALLDALSKKVPLPFGVRTITTPRGTRSIRALDDLYDGGAYVCSDQKRVKPLNLNQVTRRQVPWNTARPLTVAQGLRPGQFGQRNSITGRPAKVTERVAVRTPKRLVVIKNKDPTLKRTIVLQRRTAPTFDALLDYLSQILQFPVLRLYTTDGRRVDGLAALILCSGVVVAAGNEPFRLGSSHRLGQMAAPTFMETVETSMSQPRLQKHKPLSSGRGSRNFSLSSEQYIINQINKCQTGGGNPHDGSLEAEVRGTAHGVRIVPQEDDIEKSFRINQDGSMTVEMKVHLTIKEEEMLHWTTTLSRSTVRKRAACASVSGSANNSPDSNNALTKNSSSLSDGETKEDNYSAGARRGVGQINGGDSSATLEKAKGSLKRTPTPGPRRGNKKASVESVKMVGESGLQESTLGHYSYMERTADGDTTEGYCLVRHSSSSNRPPIPKPRKTASAEKNRKHSSLRSSGKAEVLQIRNNGLEVTETVMHFYETQGCYDNYFANEEFSVDSVPIQGSAPVPGSKQSSKPHSLSNDCDIDCSWKPPTADSLQQQKEEMLSLSSDPVPPTAEITNNLSSNSQKEEGVKRESATKRPQKRSRGNHKSSASVSGSGALSRASKISPSKKDKQSSTEKLSSDTSVRKKSLNSSESTKSGQRAKTREKKTERPPAKKSHEEEKTVRKDAALSTRAANIKRTPPETRSSTKTLPRDNGHNVNTPSVRASMKKNMSDILKAKKSSMQSKKTISKPKSMTDNRISQPENPSEPSDSVPMPSLNPSPAQIQQYVESWLENVSADPVPYEEDEVSHERQAKAKVVFHIGADSESEEKDGSRGHLEVCHPPPCDTVKKSTSCLAVPLHHEGQSSQLLHADARGLCVSMPSVRVQSEHVESALRSHKSAEVIGPEDEAPSSSLRPAPKLKPVLRQICSSIQCIRRASDIGTSHLEKSSSMPDFPTQVASVFGSSCKAFLSFLSVMSLRESLKGSSAGAPPPLRTSSEAMLMMQSLQKISAIEDEEEQRASLTELRSGASSQFRERWRDFLILRERLESEPLSPKVSETEFALDVASDAEDVFDEQHRNIGALMEELDVPQDLRAEITSTIQQTKSFYPQEESTFLETDRNQSDSEDGVEHFESRPPPEATATSTDGGTAETKHADDGGTDESPGEAHQELQKSEEVEEKEDINETEGDTGEHLDTTELAGKGGGDGEKEEEVEGEEGHTDEETEGESVEKEEEDLDDEELVEDNRNKDKETQGQPVGSHHVEDTDEREGDEESEEDEVSDEAEEEPEQRQAAMSQEGEDKDEGHSSEDQTEKGSEGREARCHTEEVEEEEQDEEEEVTERAEEEVKESIEEAEEGKYQEVIEEEEEEKGEMEEEEEEAGEEERVQEEVDDEEENENVVEEGDGVSSEEEENVEHVVEKGREENVSEESAEDEEEHEGGIIVGGTGEEEEGMVETMEKNHLHEAVSEEEHGEEEEGGKEEARGEEDVESVQVKSGYQNSDEDAESSEGSEKNRNRTEEEEEEISSRASQTVEEEEDEEGEEEEEKRNSRASQTVEEEEGEEGEEEEEERNSRAGQTVEEEEDEEGEEEEEERNSRAGQTVEEEEEDEEEPGVETKSRASQTVEEEEEGEEEEERNSRASQTVEEEEDEEGEEEEEKRNSRASQTVEEEEEEEGEEEEEERNSRASQTVEEEEEEEERGMTQSEEGSEGEAGDGSDADVNQHLDLQLLRSHRLTGSREEDHAEPPTQSSSECQCEEDKGDGLESVDGEGEQREECSSEHPVEISQELLDFVNFALKSSSLIFTYDAQGNLRIEPDSARMASRERTSLAKSRRDTSYGSKCLPSPGTSDLSDYRPETSESGGYKSQDSLDIVSDSGEERFGRAPSNGGGGARGEQVNYAGASDATSKDAGSFSSSDSGNKTSRDYLSYCSAGSSPGAEAVAPPTPETDSPEGVLIDQGRWLLKENHLMRKSPPESGGMYDHLDSTSVDTNPPDTNPLDNMEAPPPHHCQVQRNPLLAISSSELEEMARPSTPKCTYYNMPHGSDSDPFLDDSSVKSETKVARSVRGRGFRVSPVVDTSKTWANKNGSLSSFASVEFKIPDGRVHPEGGAPAAERAARPPSGGERALQPEDSLEALHVRCGQYCPIL